MANVEFIEEEVLVTPSIIEVIQYQTIHGVNVDDIDDAMMEAHINDPTPHPAYDTNMPSLKILFENGLV